MKYNQTRKAQEEKKFYVAKASIEKHQNAKSKRGTYKPKPFIKAMYIGDDTFGGFEKGVIYHIKSQLRQNCIWVYDDTSKRCCPYSKLESLLFNWKIIE